MIRRPVQICLRTALWLTLLLAPVAAHAQTAPLVVPPRQFNEQAAPGYDPQVAALDRQTLAVGWLVPEGPEAGVYLRWRINYLVAPPMRIADGATTVARDLAMAFDSAGRLHVVWTAQTGAARLLQHARIDAPGGQPALIQTLAGADDRPTSAPAAREPWVEFPALAPAPDGSILIAWQQSQGIGYAIQTARIEADGTTLSLGSVSGGTGSGLNPQILSTDPPRIAWQEVTAIGHHLRVDEWDGEEGRWRPSALELPARLFEEFGQAQLQLTPDGRLIGLWRELDIDGGSLVVVGRQPHDGSATDAPGALEIDIFNDPPGDHGSPVLDVADSPTLAWQVFDATGVQSIRVARVFDADGLDGPEPLTVSTPEQRFAALPAIASLDGWSAVVWVDDARDGGTGDVFLSEIIWPARR